jgi:hypothetical protein
MKMEGQMILPFAEREYVDVRRCGHILGVSIGTVYRLAGMKDRGGRELLFLVSYRHNARKRVLYSSIVHFCDYLRTKYGVTDRRPVLSNPIFRHRDEDLLPFPLSDTIYSEEALIALGYEDRRPLVRLIQEGKFEAYQIVPRGSSAWRISRSSFGAFLAATRDRAISKERSLPTEACF